MSEAREALRAQIEGVLLDTPSSLDDSYAQSSAVTDDLMSHPETLLSALAGMTWEVDCPTCGGVANVQRVSERLPPNLSDASVTAIEEVLRATHDVLGCPNPACSHGKVSSTFIDALLAHPDLISALCDAAPWLIRGRQ